MRNTTGSFSVAGITQPQSPGGSKRRSDRPGCGAVIVVPRYGERRGNPVDRRLFGAMLSLEGDTAAAACRMCAFGRLHRRRGSDGLR